MVKMQVPKLLLKTSVKIKNKMIRWTTIRKIQNLLTFLFIFIVFCTFHLIRIVNKIDLSSENNMGHQTGESGEQFCKIPELNPFEPAILELMGKEPFSKDLTCPSEQFPLLFDSFVDKPYPRLVPKKRIKSLSRDYEIKSCCYRNVTNAEVDTVNCYNISMDKPTEVSADFEFIAIECTYQPKTRPGRMTNLYFKRIVDMHAFVHMKPEVIKRVMDQRRKLKKLKKKGEESSKLNVIVIGLDSVSRMSFMRTFPETREYLIQTLNAVEMEGFNKIGDNTLPNIGPLLTNLPVTDGDHLSCFHDNSSDTCPFIWKKYAENGYHTLYTEDEHSMSMFNRLKLSWTPKSQTDYYFPQFTATADKLIGHQKKLLAKCCFGPRTAFQVMLDYMKKMSVVMKGQNENYFQFAWSTSLTHDSINGGYLADKDLMTTLKFWKEGGYLDNTVLILLSDHGARFGEIHSLYQGQLEDRLPFMHVVVPSSFHDKYPKAYQNLMDNRKRLITTWDVYQTLHHLLQPMHLRNSALSVLEESLSETREFSRNPGISLFFEIPLSRTCEDAGIPISYCTCNHHMEPLPVNDPLVDQAANHAVQQINSLLIVSTSHLCAYLYLDKILHAGMVSFGEEKHSTSPWKGYQVTFQTTPGEATFEALVVHHHRFHNGNSNGSTKGPSPLEWSIDGHILRTNLYANQSWCLDDKTKVINEVDNSNINNAKPYCFCLNKREMEKVK